jgi:Domain of unknown function (DUF1083).
MQTHLNPCRLLCIGAFLTLPIFHQASLQHAEIQDNPILAPEAFIPPFIDGQGNDSCWQNIPWQSISQVWIPYGAKIDSNDYTGKFKVVWSSKTNLLYFLIEIRDSVFVDGFRAGETSDIYNYDITEVFIDENKSGGLHVFDGKDSVGREWGTNAQNAFAYHIYADFPKEGEVTTKCYVYDLAGTSWSDAKSMNYSSHLPSFALRKTGHKAVWEFSLIVYNDTYEDTMVNKELARSQLFAGKVMGLSLAYCDNDHPEKNPKERDRFYGSVHVPSAAYNDHWMNADYFGTVQLVGPIPSGINNKK